MKNQDNVELNQRNTANRAALRGRSRLFSPLIIRIGSTSPSQPFDYRQLIVPAMNLMYLAGSVVFFLLTH